MERRVGLGVRAWLYRRADSACRVSSCEEGSHLDMARSGKESEIEHTEEGIG